MAPRQRATVPFLSPHAPEIVYITGLLRFGTAAQIYGASSYGIDGRQTSGMDALLSRLVKAGLLGAVSVPSGTPGRQMRAFFLTAAGYRSAGTDDSKAAAVLRDSREKARVIEGLGKAEMWMCLVHHWWRLAQPAERFSILREWALNRAKDKALDGTEQVLVNGLRKVPPTSPFGNSAATVLYSRSRGEVRDVLLVLSATSAAEARERVEKLPPMIGTTAKFEFVTIGSPEIREQFARSLSKTFAKRKQNFAISPFTIDFRDRTTSLGTAATAEERMEWVLRAGVAFPWPSPGRLAAMATFGWRDLSIVSTPLVRPPMPNRPAAPPPPPPPPPPVLDSMEEQEVDPWALPLFDGRVGRSVMTPVTAVAPIVEPAAPRVVDPRWALCPPRKAGHTVPDVDLSGRGM